MTRRKAIQVLIQHASSNVAGVGCGIRPELRPVEREEVKAAIGKLWKEANNYPLSADDLRNLGLW